MPSPHKAAAEFLEELLNADLMPEEMRRETRQLMRRLRVPVKNTASRLAEALRDLMAAEGGEPDLQVPGQKRAWEEAARALHAHERGNGRDTARTALRSILTNCSVWQDGESEMSAGDFLALIEEEARAALS